MNVLILAAGYATRLYPLTLNQAKPLLVVGGKPIIEWAVDNLAGVRDMETIYVVTNDKFASDFQAWSERYRHRHSEFKFKIVNDGSTSDNDKLGALGDINLVVTRENEQDAMTLKCECGSPGEMLRSAIAATLRAVTKLGGDVELVAPGSLPNDGKVIADERV